MIKKTLICFAAGCLGGLINSLAVWLFGDLGIPRALDVSIAPALTPHWLYPRAALALTKPDRNEPGCARFPKPGRRAVRSANRLENAFLTLPAAIHREQGS